MPKHHVISGNDSVESVAYDNGLYWETVWQHADNEALRRERRDRPNILEEGDRLFVPDIVPRDTAKPVDARYRFRRKGVPSRVELRLTIHGDMPRADVGYTVKAGKRVASGRTDADGWIRFTVMPDVRAGTLTLDTGEDFELAFSTMRPAAVLKGVQGRLRNLGYYDGPLDGQPGAALDAALRRFQADHGLQPSGEPDEATVAELETRHGS
jgi:N-acetylmuramoyl-L-alanine amidase